MATETFDWQNCVLYAAVSDIGMRRMNNQDSHAEVLANTIDAWQKRGHMFVVADGMGAHAAGELASKLAADGIPHHYHKYPDLSSLEALQKAFQDTNAEVHRRGQANTDFHNMGTTTSVLVLLPQGGLVAHVGDSRVYRLRGDRLEQLTFDHSLVWELRRAGQISDGDDVSPAVPKNVITRSLGPNPTVQVDLEGPYPLEVGDTYLICSDGLTSQVDDSELGTILASLSPGEAAQVLVDLANLRGGPDNITASVIRVQSPELIAAAAQVEPLTIRGGLRRKPMPGLMTTLWVVTTACWLTAVFLWATSYIGAAGVAVLGGIISTSIAVWQQFGSTSYGTRLGRGSRLGNGPYRSASCAPRSEFLRRLASTVGELREAAAEQEWDVDWDSFNDLSQRAQRDSDEKRYADAIRHYSQAIRFMMQELRAQRRR